MPNERLERQAAGIIPWPEDRQLRDRSAERSEAVVAQIRPLVTAAAAPDTPPNPRAVLLGRLSGWARQIYLSRRRRDRLFGGIFGEPGWDILLDLVVMEAQGKRVQVSSACIASGASHSTAIRQIDELVRCKLIVRERDDRDKRRTYLRISDHGLNKIAECLEEIEDHYELRARAN